MNPLLRIVLIVIGGCLGVILGPSIGGVGAAVLGALAALAIAELSELRSRVARLEANLTRLGKGNQSEAPIAPVAPIAPQTVAAAMLVPEPALVPTNETLFAEIPGMGAVIHFFTGGNTVVRVGVVILFFGVAFLLRYMAEHTHVPVEVRLTAIALGAIVLLIVGWRLRTTRAGYALALQGGGIGILYLTVFAALRLYAILPAAVAFPMLALVATFSAILAVKQDSMSFALLGITGGFLAPILASTGEGSHVVLFSYYALLNAGILAMAWFKAWRPLNIAGFVFTFAVGAAWGVLRYRPEMFASTEPFLILFFLFYFSITILFSVRQPVNLKGFVDGTLVFGTPIVVFAFQSLLLSDRLMTLAFSAVGMSALYLAAGGIIQRRRDATQTLMIDAFIAIGISFLTLAVPLALDASWNAAAWTLEGMALVWAGCRQNRALARTAGALLIVASVGITTFELDFSAANFVLPLRSCFGLILQSVAAIFAARTLHAHRGHLRDWEHWIPHALFWLGLFAWLGAGLGEISVRWPTLLISGWLALATFTALACSTLYRLTRFDDAKSAALLLLPVMFAMALWCAGRYEHPFDNFGWLAWPIAFIGLYLVIYRHEGTPSGRLAPFLETAAAWLFCGVFSWEAAWTVNEGIAGGDAWEAAAWIVIPAIFLFLLPRLVKRVDWPFVKNGDAYVFVAGMGVAASLSVWSFWTNVTSSGDCAPLPYVPFLNPLDLAQALILLILLRYGKFLDSVKHTRFARLDQRLPLRIVSVLGFIWLTAALLRTLHQWFGIALDTQVMMNSTLVQTSVSIFWASIAFVTMLIGARRRRRNVWIVGAMLLGVVIAKLFLVDLSRIGSIERIVSFVGVGLLMLVVGYLSPLPPTKESAR